MREESFYLTVSEPFSNLDIVIMCIDFVQTVDKDLKIANNKEMKSLTVCVHCAGLSNRTL